MNYNIFVKKLENYNLELFDYEKRQLYYQLTNKKNDNMNGGGKDKLTKFFKCNNKKYIVDSYKNKYFNIEFIDSNYQIM